MPAEFPEQGRCPRDGNLLVPSAGALGEDVCTQCQGRTLDASATAHLLCDVLGIARDLLGELARDGVRRMVCPACATRMTSTWTRGVQVELCGGCGSCFLDGGELARLAKGAVEEVRVSAGAARGREPEPVVNGASDPASHVHGGYAPGMARSSISLELNRTSTRSLPSSTLRFGLRCIHCEVRLDLTRDIWMVNTRPWCDDCARPYTSPWAAFVSWVGGAMRLLVSLRTRPGVLLGLADRGEELGRWERSADVLRVSPAEHDRFFGSSFVLLRDDE